MKPMACGNQVYSTGSFSSAATMSAILFSKPSPLSLENGRLAGSAQTRSAVRSTRSIRCPCATPRGSTRPRANSVASLARLLLFTEASLLVLFGGGGLIDPLGRAPAWYGPVCARLQVDVDVFEIARDVAIVAKCRHDTLFVRADHLPAGGDDQDELRIAPVLQGMDEARRIGRALAVRPVAGVAVGMVAAEARVRVPVDRAVTGDVVGRIAVGGLPLAVLLRLGRLRNDDAEARQQPESGNEHQCNANTLHINLDG